MEVQINENVSMYIDSHTHLDFFEGNIDKAIKGIIENKIVT